jgi:hypothetical protein
MSRSEIVVASDNMTVVYPSDPARIQPSDQHRHMHTRTVQYIPCPSLRTCQPRTDQGEGKRSSRAASSFLDLFFVESPPAAKKSQDSGYTVRGDHDCKDGFQSNHVSVEYDGNL